MTLPLIEENEFVFPDAWRRRLHPRHGGARGPAAKPDKKAGPQTDELIAQARQAWVDAALDDPTSDEPLVEAMRRAIDGVPDALGAAGLARATPSGFEENITPFADAWFLRHGAAFAAEASVLAAKIYAAQRDSEPLRVNTDDGYYTPPLMRLLRRTRALLAACSDKEYAKAVDALHDRQACCQSCRVSTAYLVPTETEWVVEACRLHSAAYSPYHHWRTQLLVYSLSTTEQAAQLGGALYPTSADMLITMIDGLGEAAVPLFARPCFGPRASTETVRTASAIVAELPSDGSFRFLLEHIDQSPVAAAILNSALLRPRRAVRLLAEASQGAASNAVQARALLQRYVRANPEVAAALVNDLPESGKALVLEVLEGHDVKPEAPLEALPALLVAPPWLQGRQKAPRILGWLAPVTLPQVLLADGRLAVPSSCVIHLLGAFSLSTATKPYPGLPEALEALDHASVEAFAWSAFSTWREFDHPRTEAWTLGALGLVGDDETVARLVPIIKAWPGESGHHRAVAGLDVLEAIGTDSALRRINEIAQRTPFKALKEHAGRKIASIAARLGLTADQLADRLVPDLGLDAMGGLWLDYGPRRFRVGFDEQLKPLVSDEAGARRKDLPQPNSEDDAELAAAARKRFSALKKEARGVAADAIRRLEAAVADQRSWTAAEFTQLLAGHPLLRHVVRRLVWVAEFDGAREGFRVAEDGTFADDQDAAYQLADAASVRLAHPLTLTEGLVSWSAIFSDYKILQPFEQLGRPVYALTDQERSGSRLSRFEGLTLPVGRILGLTKLGWERSRPMDAGIQNCVYKRLPSGRYLIIDLHPGIAVGFVDELGDQTLRDVYLSAQAQDYHRGLHGDEPLLDELDPLTASELLRELNRLVD